MGSSPGLLVARRTHSKTSGVHDAGHKMYTKASRRFGPICPDICAISFRVVSREASFRLDFHLHDVPSKPQGSEADAKKPAKEGGRQSLESGCAPQAPIIVMRYAVVMQVLHANIEARLTSHPVQAELSLPLATHDIKHSTDSRLPDLGLDP